MVERKFAEKFRAEHVDASAEEIRDIALLSVEMAACDVAEVYSPPRFCKEAGYMGFRPGFSIDLTVNKSNGTPWDMLDPYDQKNRGTASRSGEASISHRISSVHRLLPAATLTPFEGEDRSSVGGTRQAARS